MSTGNDNTRVDLLQGTLDMLILRTLLFGPAHGHTIAHAIEKGSEEVLQVEHGSLYPALHRLVRQGLISAKDGTSENNRKAKFYSITRAGRKQLVTDTAYWQRLASVMTRVLSMSSEGDN